MTLRKRNYLISVCALAFSAVVYFAQRDDRLLATCVNGTKDAADIAACTKLIENPTDKEPALLSVLHVRRAQKFVRLDRIEEALPDLERAIALDDTQWQSFTQRGIVYSKLGDKVAALRDFERSLQISPDRVWTLQWQASVHFDLRDYQDALDSYDAVLAILPRYIPALAGRINSLSRLKRSDAALAASSDLLAVSPDHLWTLNKRARFYAEAAQFAPAIDDMRRYLALCPNDAKSHSRLGSYYYRNGQTEKAAEAFDRAFALAPDDISPLMKRINLWLILEDYERLVLDAQRAYEVSPNEDGVLLTLFTAYSKTGQDAQADQILDQWARQQPEFLALQASLEAQLGVDHPMASFETNILLVKGFAYGFPPIERPEIALATIETYFEAAGPEAIMYFQRFLDRIGLYRGDFSGVYDDATSRSLSACIAVALTCWGEWANQSAL